MRVEGKRKRSPVLIEEKQGRSVWCSRGFLKRWDPEAGALALKSKETAWKQRDVKTLHYTASDIKLD